MWKWLLAFFGEPEADVVITVVIPRRQYNAIQTMKYLEKEKESDTELTNSDIVVEALDGYLRKKLWVTHDKDDYTTAIKRKETYKTQSTGMRQSR